MILHYSWVILHPRAATIASNDAASIACRLWVPMCSGFALVIYLFRFRSILPISSKLPVLLLTLIDCVMTTFLYPKVVNNEFFFMIAWKLSAVLIMFINCVDWFLCTLKLSIMSFQVFLSVPSQFAVCMSPTRIVGIWIARGVPPATRRLLAVCLTMSGPWLRQEVLPKLLPRLLWTLCHRHTRNLLSGSTADFVSIWKDDVPH